MTKWFSGLLLLTSTAFGWGSSEYFPPSTQPPSEPTLATLSFPLNPDQEWFVKPSLLVWRPYQDDIDTGYTLSIPSVFPTISKDKTQNVDFEWGTGARLTIGRYLPNHEQWDVTLASTFFYSDTDQTVKGRGFSSLGSLSITQIKAIVDGWNPSILGTSLETDLNWRINYFTWDLAIGRLYNLTSKIVIHPYLCLRSLLIYEKYSNKNASVALNTTGNLALRHTKFKALNSVWGIGPRLGSDFAFYFGRGWTFMGGLSGSVVMGRYNIKEHVNGFIFTSSIPFTQTKLKIRDADTVMRANLEGNIGLGWEKWVRKHTVRVAPSFVFEATQWFLINNWVATNLPRSPSPGNPDWGMVSARRMGDLGFLGFTVNLQVDF